MNWRAGREAATHEVHFSENAQAIADGTALVDTIEQNRYDLASLDLKLGQTYFWRIDEVNEAETPSVWEGSLWSFSTNDYLVLDDFESYDDNEHSII